MEFPSTLRYSAEHEWAVLEGDRVRVGITDYAQDALGDVVYVDLPEVGRQAAAGESIAEVESTKSVSDIYCPVAGTITAVNSSLGDEPDLVNADPYGAGWLFDLEPTDPGDLDALLDVAAYRALVEG